jgi:hypothetical protein
MTDRVPRSQFLEAVGGVPRAAVPACNGLFSTLQRDVKLNGTLYDCKWHVAALVDDGKIHARR